VDDIEPDFWNMGVKRYIGQELWTEENGHLSWGKPRPNLKGCSAKEDEEEEGAMLFDVYVPAF
jgi:hypothetical protein